jgi:hypothetical protein
MNDFDLGLRAAAIMNIVIDDIQEDFVFVVGGQSYKCPRVRAEFLSPRLCLSHSVDPSITEYVDQNSDFNDEFRLFLSLGSGSIIRVPKVRVDFFLSLSREFGNSDLYLSLLGHFDRDFIYSQRHDSITLDLFSADLIGRISSNFSGLIESELEGIPVCVLFPILSHHFLIILREDDLFCYVSSHFCSDPDYSDFLQFVRFEYILSDCVCCFFSADRDSIDGHLWDSVSRRLISYTPREV